MTCEEFRNGEPDGLGHRRDCVPCAEWADRSRRLIEGLRLLGKEWHTAQAPARVERNLTAAFRSHAGLSVGAPTGTLWWAVGAWAAAVVVTTGLALLLASGRQPDRTRHTPRRAMTQLAATEVPAEMGMAEAEGAGDFIPLPNAEAVAPHEAVNLVRVELPRSAMIALGYAVAAERAEDPVEADVILGADGVARAVRFLD